MEPIRFRSRIRFWNPDKAIGLAVADVPNELIAALGGLRQQRVRGSIDAADFTSNVMPAGAGRLALSVSKSMLAASGATVWDEVEFLVTGVGTGA
jgi:hypothetical protein